MKISGEIFEKILNTLPNSIYLKNSDGRYLWLNQAAIKELAHKYLVSSSILGKTDFEIFPALNANEYAKNDKKIIKEKQGISKEEAVVLPSGQKMTQLSFKEPLYDDSSEFIGILGYTIDITEIKKTQAVLVKAKEQAEATSRAKTEFIAHMSHDVKTPLSGIISLSESLSSLVQEEYRECMQDIKKAGQHLMGFFNNCIELSKLESGAIFLSKETFRLKNLVAEMLDLFRPTMKSKKLALYVDYDEKIPRYLLGNRATLYRILLNLMGNAIKFTPQGSVTISAELSQNSTSNQAIIQLAIADTGIGIPEDKQKLIFERFSRLTPSDQGTYEGSGIGLYLVEEFVKSMGGEIYIKSKESQGSQFLVVIPLQIPVLADHEYNHETDLLLATDEIANIKEPAIKTNEIKVFSASENRIEAVAANIKILLVEDNLLAQKGASLLLSSFGCQTDVASCGQAAISMFKPGYYDLVFMDLGLPDIKGNELAKRLREIEEGTPFSVPIMGLSAHVEEEQARLCTAAGMAGIMTKPLLQDQAKILFAQYVPKLQSVFGRHLLVMKNGLRVIDLPKPPKLSIGKEKIAWKMLDELIASFPKFRTEIEEAYQTEDMVLLQQKMHQFRGGACYTNTPHLLNAAGILDKNLRDGDYGRLDVLFADFLKAMEMLEQIRKSLG